MHPSALGTGWCVVSVVAFGRLVVWVVCTEKAWTAYTWTVTGVVRRVSAQLAAFVVVGNDSIAVLAVAEPC